MLYKLPLELLQIIFKKLPREKRYKFNLINNELRIYNESTRYLTIHIGARAKFYQLVKKTITFNSWNSWNSWNCKDELSNMNYHYLKVEEYYKLYKEKQYKFKLASFDDYFNKYLYRYENKNKELIKKMENYNIFP